MISAGACNWDKGQVRGDGMINGRTNSTYTC